MLAGATQKAAAAARADAIPPSDDQQGQGTDEDDTMQPQEELTRNATSDGAEEEAEEEGEEEDEAEDEEDWSGVPGWTTAARGFQACPIGWPPADLFLPL